MNTEAIERIKGFCCEVDEEKWKELVRVADEVGAPMCGILAADNTESIKYKYVGDKGTNLIVGWYSNPMGIATLIPFPDFLAKLKGEENWQPKAGEMVNGSLNGKNWSDFEYEYIAAYCGKHVVKHMPVRGEWIAGVWDYVRPLRPAITRTEAESLLGKRIID
jgi:hypothetical protein